MSQHSNLDFAYERIAASHFLFSHQAEFTQLFKMMLRYTWTTEVQDPLYFPNTHGTTALQKKPIDLPIFASKGILKLGFILGAQGIVIFCEVILDLRCL